DRITKAGLEVLGGFIVGFDCDSEDIFALQREFLGVQPIPLAMVGILTALPATALWRRLEAEGRLRERSNGDVFSRPNFVPVMEEGALLRGYAELMRRLYLPEAYYRRCETYQNRAGPLPKTRPTTLGEVGALLRTIWHVGVLSPHRRHFWRLMAKALLRGRGRVRQAVAHAVQGEHLIWYTREHVLPRLERALAESQAETKDKPLDALVVSGSGTVREGKGAYGYNVLSGEYEDVVEAGVIDRSKVVRVALQNGASVASPHADHGGGDCRATRGVEEILTPSSPPP
ncbi:DUF4070 domain-containing protein, partial [Planctomycetota bacterium]